MPDVVLPPLRLRVHAFPVCKCAAQRQVFIAYALHKFPDLLQRSVPCEARLDFREYAEAIQRGNLKLLDGDVLNRWPVVALTVSEKR